MSTTQDNNSMVLHNDSEDEQAIDEKFTREFNKKLVRTLDELLLNTETQLIQENKGYKAENQSKFQEKQKVELQNLVEESKSKIDEIKEQKLSELEEIKASMLIDLNNKNNFSDPLQKSLAEEIFAKVQARRELGVKELLGNESEAIVKEGELNNSKIQKIDLQGSKNQKKSTLQFYGLFCLAFSLWILFRYAVSIEYKK